MCANSNYGSRVWYRAASDLRYHCHLDATANGNIQDLHKTKDAIQKVSASAPFSIIIVGVGDEEFGEMSKLAADTGALAHFSHGETNVRNSVHFTKVGASANVSSSVLGAVSKQLLNYMCANKTSPPSFAELGVPVQAPEGDWYSKYYK